MGPLTPRGCLQPAEAGCSAPDTSRRSCPSHARLSRKRQVTAAAAGGVVGTSVSPLAGQNRVGNCRSASDKAHDGELLHVCHGATTISQQDSVNFPLVLCLDRSVTWRRLGLSLQSTAQMVSCFFSTLKSTMAHSVPMQRGAASKRFSSLETRKEQWPDEMAAAI